MTTQEASAHAHHPHPHPTSRPALKKRPTSSGRLSRLAALTTSKVNTPSKTHRHTRSKSSTCDSESEREPEENDHMAASFLQYCAYCEKQIEVPTSSILYCSESCRKRDIRSSQAYELFSHDTPSTSPPKRTPSSADLPVKDIIPQLSPTLAPRPYQPPNSDSYAFTDAGSRSRRGSDMTQRPSSRRNSSEAARYLAQFHSKEGTTPRTQYGIAGGNESTPSLSSTATSISSTSRPYTPGSSTSRPSGRLNRWGSTTSTKSIDLVTPVAQYPTAPSSMVTITEKTAKLSIGGRGAPRRASDSPDDADSLSYEKKRALPGFEITPGRSSLKQLFQFDEMRATATKRP